MRHRSIWSGPISVGERDDALQSARRRRATVVLPASRFTNARAILVAGKASLPLRIATRRWRGRCCPGGFACSGQAGRYTRKTRLSTRWCVHNPDALATARQQDADVEKTAPACRSRTAAVTRASRKAPHASISISSRSPTLPALGKPPDRTTIPADSGNTAFFEKRCTRLLQGRGAEETDQSRLVPKSGGGSVQMTSVNGVADRLRAVQPNSTLCRPRSRSLLFPAPERSTVAPSRTPETAVCTLGEPRSTSIRNSRIMAVESGRNPIAIRTRRDRPDF